jgi:hypothetical protein
VSASAYLSSNPRTPFIIPRLFVAIGLISEVIESAHDTVLRDRAEFIVMIVVVRRGINRRGSVHRWFRHMIAPDCAAALSYATLSDMR